MENDFLGRVIKADRKKVGITQDQLQNKARELSILRDETLSKEEKDELLNVPENAIRLNKKWISCSFPSSLIGKIERGIARDISKRDLSIIAEILGHNVSRYVNLEVNPIKLLDSRVPETPFPSDPFIERSLVFDPEYRQAGVSILSFFSEVVDKEFADQSVKVGILQNGNSVTLRIETPDGRVLKEVEKKLNTYGLAIMGKAAVETISSDRVLVQELKTRLEVTSLELKLRKEAYLERSNQYESRIGNLESQINNLHAVVGQGLSYQMGLVETIKSLANNESLSVNFVSALGKVSEIIQEAKSAESEEKLKNLLAVLEHESPGMLSKLARTIESIPASIVANLITPWAQAIIMSMPK